MDSIYKYKDFGQNIYHFNSLESVEESQFGAILDPIIVIAEDKSGDHTQIKVLPFNLFNTDKNELDFKDKMQYFKRTIREAYGANIVTIQSNNDIVTTHIDLFNEISNLTTDEVTEFMTGFNTSIDIPYTFDVFFGTKFLDLKPETLTEFKTTIKGEI